MWPVPFGGGWQRGNAVLDATCVTRHDHQGGTVLHQPNPWEKRVELSKARFQFSVSFSEKPDFSQQNRVFDQVASPTHKKASKTHNLLFCGLVAHPPTTWVNPSPPPANTPHHIHREWGIHRRMHIHIHIHAVCICTYTYYIRIHTWSQPTDTYRDHRHLGGRGEHQTLGHIYIYMYIDMICHR